MDIICPLSEDDLTPYSPRFNKVVVRIFKKGRLFVGKLHNLDFSTSSELTIRLGPMVQLHTNQDSADFEGFGESLVTIKDVLVEKTYTNLSNPFSPIQNPDRVSLKTFRYDNALAIKFADGIAILSKRDLDIKAVEEILKKAEMRDTQTQ